MFGKKKEVGNFLGQLVVDGGQGNRNGELSVAQRKGSSHQNTIGEVVKEVSEQYRSSKRVVNVFGVRQLFAFTSVGVRRVLLGIRLFVLAAVFP